MQELIDGSSTECIGFSYMPEESRAAIFALGLYAGQLTAGNIIENPEDNEAAVELVRLMDELRLEFEAGLGTVTPQAHRALTEIFFPYVYRMHHALPSEDYTGVCEKLGVTPYELFDNALVAERIIQNADLSVALA